MDINVFKVCCTTTLPGADSQTLRLDLQTIKYIKNLLISQSPSNINVYFVTIRYTYMCVLIDHHQAM
jgi:hypothetical protein